MSPANVPGTFVLVLSILWGLLGQIDSESEAEECSETQMSEELASDSEESVE